MVSGHTVSERGLPGHVKTADAEEFPFDTGKREHQDVRAVVSDRFRRMLQRI